MADVQLENGYSRIATELLEALCASDISGAEFRVLLVIIRQTWGLELKSNVITHQQIADTTCLNKRTVRRCIDSLGVKMVLKVTKRHQENEYQLVKDYELWKLGVIQPPGVKPPSPLRVKMVTPEGQIGTMPGQGLGVKRPIAEGQNGQGEGQNGNAHKVLELNNKSTSTKVLKESTKNLNTLVETDEILETENVKPKKPRSPKVMFDYETGKMEPIPKIIMDAWKIAYPGINIQKELKRATAWMITNPKNRKKDFGRYYNNWLSYAQERFRGGSGGESFVEKHRKT